MERKSGRELRALPARRHCATYCEVFYCCRLFVVHFDIQSFVSPVVPPPSSSWYGILEAGYCRRVLELAFGLTERPLSALDTFVCTLFLDNSECVGWFGLITVDWAVYYKPVIVGRSLWVGRFVSFAVGWSLWAGCVVGRSLQVCCCRSVTVG